MTAMVKDLVGLEEALIRREVMRMILGLCVASVIIGGAGMIKGSDAAAELASLEFGTHASCVQYLEIEASAVQAQIDAQESAGV